MLGYLGRRRVSGLRNIAHGPPKPSVLSVPRETVGTRLIGGTTWAGKMPDGYIQRRSMADVYARPPAACSRHRSVWACGRASRRVRAGKGEPGSCVRNKGGTRGSWRLANNRGRRLPPLALTTDAAVASSRTRSTRVTPPNHPLLYLIYLSCRAESQRHEAWLVSSACPMRDQAIIFRSRFHRRVDLDRPGPYIGQASLPCGSCTPTYNLPPSHEYRNVITRAVGLILSRSHYNPVLFS